MLVPVAGTNIALLIEHYTNWAIQAFVYYNSEKHLFAISIMLVPVLSVSINIS